MDYGNAGGRSDGHLFRIGNVVVDRRLLTRVLALINGKGGVGKTTLSVHLAALAAAAGYRVLVVDLDIQGNVALDLGVEHLSDDGAALLTAVITGGAPAVVENVRPNLDIVCGGPMLAGLESALTGVAEQARDRLAGQMRIAQVLQQIAPRYDLVVLDCPPNKRGVPILSAAQFVLAPTHSDAASIKGLGLLAKDFTEAREVNPSLELLGVVLYGTTPGATVIAAEASADINAALEGAAPLMGTTVRHVESVAMRIRKTGKLAHELEASLLDVAQLRGTKPRTGSTATLAGDLQALTGEVLGRFNARVLELEAVA
jgi:cellulose biosynthesis protein BcsQ